MCNSCYQEAESRGGTHAEPLAAKLRNAPEALWTTRQGLLVSVAFVVMVVSVFLVAVRGLS